MTRSHWLRGLVLLLGISGLVALANASDVIGPGGRYGLIESLSSSGTTDITVHGTPGIGDCVVYDDNGVQGCTRTTDAAPNSVLLTGQNSLSSAVTNTTGGNLNIGAGDGSTKVTIVDYTLCATDSVTPTIDGTGTARTEGTHWTASVSNASTATSLAAALDALAGITATATSAVVNIKKDITTASLSVAVSDATCATAANGTDGTVNIYHTVSMGTGTQILAAGGSQGTPGFGFVAEPGLGWFRSSADEMRSSGGSLSIRGLTSGAIMEAGTQGTVYLTGSSSTTPKWQATGSWGFIDGGATRFYYPESNEIRLGNTTPLCSSSNADADAATADACVHKIAAGYYAIGTSTTTTTRGSLSAKSRLVNNNNTTLTLDDTYTGWVVTNETNDATRTVNLPSAATATSTTGIDQTCLRFAAQDADDMKVVAASGDTIRIGGSVTAAAGFICLASIGDAVNLCAINATEWFAFGSSGAGITFDSGCP